MIRFSPELSPAGSVYQPEQLGFPVAGDLFEISQDRPLIFPAQPVILEPVNGLVDKPVPVGNSGGSQRDIKSLRPFQKLP